KYPQYLPSRLAHLYAKFYFCHGLSRTQAILADSVHTKRDLVKLAKVSPEKISVFPLAVSETFRPSSDEEIDRVRQRHALQGPYLLYVGNLRPLKNVSFLIRVCEQIRKRHPEMPTLVLAGRNFMPQLDEVLRSTPGLRWLAEVADQDL